MFQGKQPTTDNCDIVYEPGTSYIGLVFVEKRTQADAPGSACVDFRLIVVS